MINRRKFILGFGAVGLLGSLGYYGLKSNALVLAIMERLDFLDAKESTIERFVDEYTTYLAKFNNVHKFYALNLYLAYSVESIEPIFLKNKRIDNLDKIITRFLHSTSYFLDGNVNNYVRFYEPLRTPCSNYLASFD